MADQAAMNTDRELWRKTSDDYRSPSLHVTKGDGIGMNVGGYVIVMPIEKWHSMAQKETAHLIKPKPTTADPAQSAPSAEPEKFLYERLGFAFKAINDSLTVTIFRPKFRIFSFSQYDRKWDVVYLMDKAWELLVELAQRSQETELIISENTDLVARLQKELQRTAQLERERQQVLDILWKDIDCERDEKLSLIHVAAKASNAIYWRNQDITVLRTRAEQRYHFQCATQQGLLIKSENGEG